MTTKKKSFQIFAKITHKGRFKGEELKGGNKSKGKGKENNRNIRGLQPNGPGAFMRIAIILVCSVGPLVRQLTACE